MSNFYDEKAKQVYLKLQSASNVAQPASAIISTDAVAGFEPTFAMPNTTETVEYADDQTSKEVFTSIIDRTGEIGFKTFFPALVDYASLSGSTPATEANFPLERLMEIAGATVTYSADATHQVQLDDLGDTGAVGTVLVSRVAPQTPLVQKLFRFFNCRAQVDLDITIGKRAILTWMLKGIPVELLEPPELFPEARTTVVADYGQQKSAIAAPIRPNQVKQAQFVPYVDGTDLPAPFTGNVITFCIQHIVAANLFGYVLNRIQTTCGDEYILKTQNTDVVISIMEPEIGTAGYLEPDAVAKYSLHTGAMLEAFFQFGFQWGAVDGKKYYIEFTKLQLSDSKETTIDGKIGRDLTFKNCGHVKLAWR